MLNLLETIFALVKKECQILQMLLHYPKKIFTKEELLWIGFWLESYFLPDTLTIYTP